jgi:hypothetical protein
MSRLWKPLGTGVSVHSCRHLGLSFYSAGSLGLHARNGNTIHFPPSCGSKDHKKSVCLEFERAKVILIRLYLSCSQIRSTGGIAGVMVIRGTESKRRARASWRGAELTAMSLHHWLWCGRSRRRGKNRFAFKPRPYNWLIDPAVVTEQQADNQTDNDAEPDYSSYDATH